MTYKALYRKWRPKIFEDVVGQSHIVTTLKNQLTTKNIAHAYLFSGTRGTGKTSTAKIFARAVNCLNQVNANPCNECEVCKDILNENIMDVIEIDAASNNGVDNIREIRENVKYPPSKGKYKVYIIDEVHMLSTGAFNALLKTLEEPPPHVIFILATTEIHKLPATILSRCQKFEFKPVKTNEITDLLKNICNTMNVDSEEEALRLIALHSEGALRDALSLLEQCLSFSEEKVTYEGLLDIIGAVSHDVLIKLSNELINREIGESLYSIDKMLMEGKDIHQLVKDLIEHLRTLLLARLEVKLEEMIPLSKEAIDLILEQSKSTDSNWLIAAIHSLSNIESKMKYASNPRILLEVGIVSICNGQFDDNREGLLERVKYLEDQLSNGNIINQGSSQSTVSQKKSPISDSEEGNIKKEVGNNIESREINNTKIIGDKKLQELVKSRWDLIIDEIRREKKAASLALLKEGTLSVLADNVLEISFEENMEMFKQKLDKDKVKHYISEIVEKHTGHRLNIIFSIEGQNSVENNGEDQIIEKIKSIVPESIFKVIE